MKKLPSRLLAVILLTATFVMIFDPVFAAFLQDKRPSTRPGNTQSPPANRPPANGQRPPAANRPPANGQRPPANRPPANGQRPPANRPANNGNRPGTGHRPSHRPGTGHRPPVYRPQRPVIIHRRPTYSYRYHTYRPYSWGPSWHPLGFFVAALATTAIVIAINNQQYQYDNGIYYQPSSGGYKVVPAPVGATVGVLPSGYNVVQAQGSSYYYYGGDYYIKNIDSYQVVAAPIGAFVTNLPEGAAETTVNGNQYLFYNGTYYQPVSVDGQNGYEVIDMQEQ